MVKEAAIRHCTKLPVIKELFSAAHSLASLLALGRSLKKRYPAIASIDILLERNKVLSSELSRTSLDLGCGNVPRNPFRVAHAYGVDVRQDLGARIKCADLSFEPIPWPENFFDYVTAYDFIEHIPRYAMFNNRSISPFVRLMNEIFRVLKPGGLFLHSTPCYPSKVAFQDPTHVNIITEDTFPDYFCLPCLYAGQLGYGFNGRFTLLDQAWLKGSSIVSLLRAEKLI